MNITDARLTKALEYLSTTDEAAANAKALLIGLEEQTKTIKSVAFLEAEGSVAQREAVAYSSDEYKEHISKIKFATYDFELLRNKRLTESLIVEVWRTCQANQRRGNL